MSDLNRFAEYRNAINGMFLAPEPEALAALRNPLGEYDSQAISRLAAGLITAVRAEPRKTSIEAFLREYGLNSDEGIVLMGIAEALLRIPDTQTQNRFLREKLANADWSGHWLHSDSGLVNLATGALCLSGKMEYRLIHSRQQRFEAMLARLGEPLIAAAIKQAMRQLARRFVIAEDIEAALGQAASDSLYRYSFDMLGEAALTADDAERYFQGYGRAIEALAKVCDASSLFANPGISVKLSALYPRYEALRHRDAVCELGGKLLALAKRAKDANISVTVDAEESERLQMSLDIFEAVAADPALSGWQGLGLAVQAYQKRALAVIRWLAALAHAQRRIIPLRLVKGAYWDGEIKRAQENGLDDYPVFTSKPATDVSYLACARLVLSEASALYPQFATHNAHTVAAISIFGQGHPGFEFQRLHGMGEALYEQLMTRGDPAIPCRIYAPVGCYRDLLPYLVRRLLENGANTSFINQVENPVVSVEQLSRDPVVSLPAVDRPNVPRPCDLFGEQRKNSRGLNLGDPDAIDKLQRDLDGLARRSWKAMPVIGGQFGDGEAHPVVSPFDRDLSVGSVIFASEEQVDRALEGAAQAFDDWRLCPVETRAEYLINAAELLESHRLELVSLCIREGGRTVRDALAEVREAVDYCRYYAASAVELFGHPQKLPGPTGEENRLLHFGRGVFVCISPWNFPIAIFVGQIAAALVAGNTVIAKPAQQTSLTAMFCIGLLHRAGIPENVLHFLPGDGAAIGGRLLSDKRIAGVAFTGSTDTARIINRQLAQRSGAIAPLIAETGGQNVMIADSTAHEEQLVSDVLQSAFNSAGQRCSSLRVLFLPDDTADKVVARLIGAMRLLRVGSPADVTTDIGPIIDQRATAALEEHVEKLRREARLLHQLPLNGALANGSFFPPTAAEIPALSFLEQEVFGPILHIVRYAADRLQPVVEEVNARGYGLTLGIHSRLDSTIDYVQRHARVGNIYVNRNMIGAVVGVPPFGGMGLSGTGPKAGGPNYLLRFASEQTMTVNVTAVGGNPWLLESKEISP